MFDSLRVFATTSGKKNFRKTKAYSGRPSSLLLSPPRFSLIKFQDELEPPRVFTINIAQAFYGGLGLRHYTFNYFFMLQPVPCSFFGVSVEL